MKKLVIVYSLSIVTLFACAYPVAKKEVPLVEPEVTKIIPRKAVHMVYLPWQYRKLADIVSLCEKHTSLKMVIGFPAEYEDIKNVDSEEYKKLLSFIQEKKIEIALRLPKEPILPLIAHTDDAKDLLGGHGALPAPAFSWAEDIRQQVANAREEFFERWGVFPSGFIPSGGWLSPRAFKALKGLELEWCVSGPFDLKEGLVRINAGYPEIFFMDPPISAVMYQSDPLLGYRYISEKITEAVMNSENRIITLVFDEDHYKNIYNRRITPLINMFADSLEQRTTDVYSILPREITGTSPFQFRKMTLKQIPICSWQHEDLSLWIGEEEENAAWGLLSQAREALQSYQNSGTASIQRLSSALDEIYEAESGDYFYSFGDDVSSVMDKKNERAFKAGLMNIYRMIGLEPPEELYHPLKEVSGYSRAATQVHGTTMEVGPGYIRWLDMQGDDHGSGDIEYPLPREQYPPGSYDLKYFGVRYDDQQIYFEVCLGTIVSILNSPVGMDLPLIDIYMDLNNRSGAGATRALPARDFYIDSQDAWEYCININGWGARLYRSYSRNDYRKVNTDITVSVLSNKNTVIMSVSRDTLRGNPLNWGYIVVVMGNDRENTASPPHPLKVVNNPNREHVFRGTWAGFTPPPIIDILVPQGKDQHKLLGVYKNRMPITLPAVRMKG